MADVQDDLIDAWLATTLRADTTLTGLVGQNIYSALAPDELLAGGSVADAYAVYDFVSGTDEHVALTRVGSRVLVACRYTVKVVGAGRDRIRLRPIWRRLDALNGVEGDYLGHHFIAERVAPIRYLETSAGHHWWHLGGQFDITVHTI